MSTRKPTSAEIDLDTMVLTAKKLAEAEAWVYRPNYGYRSFNVRVLRCLGGNLIYQTQNSLVETTRILDRYDESVAARVKDVSIGGDCNQIWSQQGKKDYDYYTCLAQNFMARRGEEVSGE